jgi:hypothetical protein
LATDSKLTVAAAFAAASSGDKIIVWPGDYTESLSINKNVQIIGIDRDTVRILGNLELNSNFIHLKNLTIDSVADQTTALYNIINTITLILDNCFINSYDYGISISVNSTTKKVIIRDSKIVGSSKALYLYGTDIEAYRTDFINICAAAGNATVAYLNAIIGSFESCKFILNSSINTNISESLICIQTAVPLYGETNNLSQFLLNNCIIKMLGTVSNGNRICKGILINIPYDQINVMNSNILIKDIAGLQNGIEIVSGPTGKILISNSNIQASQYSLRNTASEMVVGGCLYSQPTFGIIKQINSGSIKWLQQNVPVGASS